jgi:putative transposase
VIRWQQNYNMVGYGHVYQSGFKPFPVETDEHFCQVNRYVERNTLRANLLKRAEDWAYGSLWIREYGSKEHRKLLSAWPLPIPKTWNKFVNKPASESERGASR